MISPQELAAARACAGGSPIAQIEHAHVFSPSPHGTDLPTEPSDIKGGAQLKETVVFEPKIVGKRYIKNPEFTKPPMI